MSELRLGWATHEAARHACERSPVTRVGRPARVMRREYPLPDRFWALVEVGRPDDCWEWSGTRVGDGYGRVQIDGRRTLAHRVALELATGQPVPDDLLVLHSCDNPPCCNPSHLFVGTHQDNSDDRVVKGRSRNLRGEQHGSARLSATDVETIRSRYQGGETQAAIASDYPVHVGHISRIVRGISWAS